MIYALDTNIISYVLNGNASLAQKLNTVVLSENKVIIPLMVYYEARRGLLANGATAKIRLFDNLCEKLGIYSLTKYDMNTAAVIYADRKRKDMMIDDGDLLIAAQCLTNGYTLVTHNMKHFKDIEGLTVIDWYE